MSITDEPGQRFIPDIEPIPVHIVSTSAEPIRDVQPEYGTCFTWSVNTMALMQRPIRLLSRRYRRKKALVIISPIPASSSLVLSTREADLTGTAPVGAIITTPSTTPTINQIPLGASGVATYNNNSVGVSQTITGGTVTAIAINGTSTGLTSGTFFVPAGGTVSVTYTVAPTTFTTAAIAPGPVAPFFIDWENQQPLYAVLSPGSTGPLNVSVIDQAYEEA